MSLVKTQFSESVFEHSLKFYQFDGSVLLYPNINIMFSQKTTRFARIFKYTHFGVAEQICATVFLALFCCGVFLYGVTDGMIGDSRYS